VRVTGALRHFDALPLAERAFVRARLFSAPLAHLATRVRGARVLDVGCGHGLLCALVLHDDPNREVTGIDPDPRKIAWAQASVGRAPHTHFEVATIEQLAARAPLPFDTVLVADVLYLLDEPAQLRFLAACRAVLSPGGRLLVKEAEDDGGWRAWKALAQEKLMVQVLRRTQSSGALGFATRAQLVSLLERSGFRVDEVQSLARGSTTPHVLLVASPA
jgi:2-polyprenyl-6-hydroxyphenyl methylase/3-demethylubiquinone-9 3-methyltransferase